MNYLNDICLKSASSKKCKWGYIQSKGQHVEVLDFKQKAELLHSFTNVAVEQAKTIVTLKQPLTKEIISLKLCPINLVQWWTKNGDLCWPSISGSNTRFDSLKLCGQSHSSSNICCGPLLCDGTARWLDLFHCADHCTTGGNKNREWCSSSLQLPDLQFTYRCTCPLCLTYEVHQPSTRNASRTYCLLNTVIPVSVMPVELKSLLTTLPNSINIIIAHVGTSDFSTLVDSGILRQQDCLCYIWPYSKLVAAHCPDCPVFCFLFYIDYCWQVHYSK